MTESLEFHHPLLAYFRTEDTLLHNITQGAADGAATKMISFSLVFFVARNSFGKLGNFPLFSHILNMQ